MDEDDEFDDELDDELDDIDEEDDEFDDDVDSVVDELIEEEDLIYNKRAVKNALKGLFINTYRKEHSIYENDEMEEE